MSTGTYGTGTYGGLGASLPSGPSTIHGRDRLIIEDLDVNDLISWFILEDPGFQFTGAKKKLNFVGSSLSDGSIPSGDESRYDNAEMQFAVARAVAGSVDDGFAALSELTAKLSKARDTQGGLPVIWTPVTSSVPLTWYMLEAEYDEFRTGRLDGYPNAPASLVHLYLRPFGYASERAMTIGITEPFLLDSLTNGQWRYDTTGGGLAVVFGLLAVTASGTRRIYRSSTVTDSTITSRFKWGTTLTGSTFSNVIKRKDANNRLVAQVAASGSLSITKTVTGPTTTTLATTSVFSEAPVAGRFYWLQASIVGDSIVVALYADGQSPLTTDTPSPIATVGYTLTGGDSTLFGIGVRGNPGLTITTAAGDTTMQVSDWVMRDAPDIFNSDPLVSFEIPNVPGHVPAEGRMTVLEGSAVARSHAEWGLECKNYDPTTVWPLLIDSDSLDTSGFAGIPSGSGQYDPDASGNSAITANQISATVPLTVCGTGNQRHIGPFRVKAHVKGDAGIQVRFAWRQGGGPLRRNDYAAPLTSSTDWQEIDLGMINVSESPVGSQRWEGRLEAFGVSSGTLAVDYLLFIPLERYGVARSPLIPLVPTTYTAFDHFLQGGASGTLDNITLPLAPADAKWHVSGANPINIDTTNHWVNRAVMADADLISGGSFARVGTTNFASVQVQADLWIANRIADNRSYQDEIRWGLLLSYQNASNWVMVTRQTKSVKTPQKGSGADNLYDHTTVLQIRKRVGGATPVLIGSHDEKVSPRQKQTVVASMDQTGIWQVYSFPVGSKQPESPIISGQDSDLAGSLQNGLFGLYDACISPNVFANVSIRAADNFAAFVAVQDNVVSANKTLEIRPETALREVTSGLGTFYGDVPMYRSSRGLYIPVAGDEDRISRVAAKMRRTDVDGGLPDGNPATDGATYTVYATPRYLHPPGSDQ